MVSSSKFINLMTEKGFGPYIGVPCSFLKPLINYIIDREDVEYIAANNEGEAVAIASGAYLAGKRPVVMFQNSGLGNTINPLTSLNYVFKIPLLLIITWRGEPGLKDEPQHELMGQITFDLLKVVRVECDEFLTPVCAAGGSDDEIEKKITDAVDYMAQTGLPCAFIMRKDTVDNYELQTHRDVPFVRGQILDGENFKNPVLERREAIAIVADLVSQTDLIVSTTGKISRELFYHEDRANQLYVVGSMGCASSIALGVALYQPEKKVIVLDGDGAALMRLEAMASIGHYRPSNLLHVIFDNESHESTGGQATLSPTVQFIEIAAACGYRSSVKVFTPGKLSDIIQQSLAEKGPHLIHVKVKRGSDPSLGRPTVTPVQVKERFMKLILKTG
ncbi:MAG: phosphonopyruvate decarboxylase [Candidatus Poribacteria bacterium]